MPTTKDPTPTALALAVSKALRFHYIDPFQVTRTGDAHNPVIRVGWIEGPAASDVQAVAEKAVNNAGGHGIISGYDVVRLTAQRQNVSVSDAMLMYDVCMSLIAGACYEAVYHPEYGRVLKAGYRVEPGLGDNVARVSYHAPEPDLSDPDRQSADERHEEAHAMVGAYAMVLTGDGWEVRESTGPYTNDPYLMVERD